MRVLKHYFRLLTVHSIIIFQVTTQLSFRPRYFSFEHAGSCPGASTDITKIEKFVVNRPNKFHYSLDADIQFLKNITAPIQFRIQAVRCSLETNSRCVQIDGLKFDNVCDRLNDENALWSPLVKPFVPRLICPIQRGLYKLRNGTADFATISRLPLEGFRYSANLKFFEMTKVKPLEFLCLEFVLTVSFASNTRPSRKNEG